MTNATIISIKEQTPVHRIFQIAMDDKGKIPFDAGQFAILELEGVRRAYTIASAPGTDCLEFIIVKVDGGQFTTKLWELKTGDAINVMPQAFGHIKLSAIPTDAPIFMISTGTGIAMMRSMLNGGALNGRKVWLLSGARYAADLGFREEISAITDPNFTAIQIASRDEYQGFQGRITSVFDNPALASKLPPLDPSTGLHIVMCGNPEMVDGMSDKFKALGFPDSQIHFEKY
ncbi:MAG: hypothetical protein LBB23_04100 [Rickettsiales bacterium]|jgi:ferredoxin--NADP+ reductase|nr:hypothetical protein [Rickettsiales bacterium]